MYNRIVELYPNTELATEAGTVMGIKPTEQSQEGQGQAEQAQEGQTQGGQAQSGNAQGAQAGQ